MKRIHVNQHVIRANIHAEHPAPPITIKEGRKNTYASEIEILGPSRMIYSAHKPLLSCGARLILETDADIRIVSPDPAEAKRAQLRDETAQL
jgi:hypothetical protein